MIPTLFSVSYGGLWGQCRLDLKAFLGQGGGRWAIRPSS